ncbi:YsnF/AvaK domain-containing protein [Micromonospora sp. NPDC007230]|uniref:YsnF/AvaK domain-containing protein n=1 Tax=Micromonospora sp. NPDC007230 TaxID=3364237 RepID=UPI0036966C69
MRLTEPQIRSLYGQDVQDRSGATIGTVGQVWANPAGEPTWVSVRTADTGHRESMAPLHAAQWQAGRLRVPYDRTTVRTAPAVEPGTDQPLGADQLTLLHRHYQLPPESAARRPERPGPPELTRFEEQARFDTETVPAGTARLRKRVVTENVHTTVPVAHEEATLVREPIAEADRGTVPAGTDTEQREMVLHAERPVVVKERVPVERVRLATHQVVEQRPAHAQVRREVVEADTPEEARPQE